MFGYNADEEIIRQAILDMLSSGVPPYTLNDALKRQIKNIRMKRWNSIGTARRATAASSGGNFPSTRPFGGRNLLLATLRDITERKKAEAHHVKLARHDLLTGLANRAVFVEALQQEMASAHRGGKSFAVLYLDLDHFKDVNDTLGIPSVTCCCKRWPSGCRRAFVRPTPSPGSAAMNSR